ncbi:DUF2628 domain-containing protein [Castellaniella sp.]|uniref:DUF2628 domain-containing protein n=1 Tax=Castellaniella sp. TaxID=1955812 RepID=UPI003A8ECF93
MRGSILNFSAENARGIITASDSKRYEFDAGEWKESIAPFRGQPVDFEVNENGMAVGVYLSLDETSPGGQSKKEISKGWQKRFSLVEKAGGPKLKEARNLPFGERCSVSFSFLAFFFGPIYYLIKGMWRKAITLLGIGLVAVIVLEFVLGLFNLPSEIISSFVIPMIFATRAVPDYYKKVVEGKDDWL